MAWPKRNAPVVLLGAALVASAALLLALTSELTFFQDTWAFLMDRRDFTADAFLQPHNEHIVVIPVAIEQLLLAVFGMSSAAPEQAVLALMLLATAALLFVYVRRRLGPWPALLAAVLLLFVGPAWQVLLWPFEVGFVGAVCFGIATLLALDRGDRRGDIAACAFLAIAIGFSSLGVAFIAGAAADVVQRRRQRGLTRAYVAAVPLLLYAAWWLGWGHAAESRVTLKNVLASPLFALDGLASSVDSLLGLSTIAVDGTGQPEWGRPLLVALLALLVYGQIRRPGLSSRLWPVAASAAAFWLLAAFNYIPGREAHASRYTYAGAVFTLLLAAELLRGVSFGRRALLVGGAVTIAAVASNLVPLKEGRDWLLEQTVLTRSDLAAIEIAQRAVDPRFALTSEVAGTASLIDIRAGNYLAAAREHGSPAYTPAELAVAPEAGRRQADIVLAEVLPLSTDTRLGGGAAAPAGSCVEVPGGGGGEPGVRLRRGVTSIEVGPGDAAALALRRFATGEYPVRIEVAPGGSTTLLRIPADATSRPWHLHVEASQTVRVCAPRGS